MARQGIYTGTSPNDGSGDSLLVGAIKINANFEEIYNIFGDGDTLNPFPTTGIGDSAISSGYANTAGIATNALYFDGQLPSYYLNYENLTNTPTLLSQFDNNVGFITSVVDESGFVVNGIVTATTYLGDGSQLTGIATAVGTAALQAQINALGTNLNIIGFYNAAVGVITGLTIVGQGRLYTGVGQTLPSVGIITGDYFIVSVGGTNVGVSTYSNPGISSVYAGDWIVGVSSSNWSILSYSQQVVAPRSTRSDFAQTLESDSNVNTTGIITAAGFRGDGGSLLNLTGAASGTYGNSTTVPQVTVNNQGKITSITNFPISFGDIGSGSYWEKNTTGLTTSSNVGIGTTNATNALTVKGSTSLESLSATSAIFTSKVGSTGSYFYEGLDPSLIGSTGGSINGSSFGYSTGGFFRYTSTSTDNVLKSYYKPTGQETVTLDIDGDLTLRTLSGNAKFIVSGDGDVLIGNNLNVSGVVTASSFVGDGSGLTNIPGGFLKNIVEDTSPQLGGSLDLNGKNIIGIGSIFLSSGDMTAYNGFKFGSNNTRTSNAYYARWGPGRTEQFRMRVFDNISGTPGIEFAISYTDTEIHVRQYSGTFIDGFPSVLTNQLTLLDTSGNTIVNNKLGIGTPNPTSKLTVSGDVLISGIVTATQFIGDGSGLTGVVGSGSGVGIKDSGSIVGSATTIDFGTGLSVSFSSGIATVNSSGSSSQWVTTSTGIHTLSNVGIGTTNAISKLSVKGDLLLDNISVGSSGFFVNYDNNAQNNLVFGRRAFTTNNPQNRINISIGDLSLSSLGNWSPGKYNVAIGYGVLTRLGQYGDQIFAFEQETGGDGNIGIGFGALARLGNESVSPGGHTYNDNASFGRSSLFDLLRGSNNIAIGSSSGIGLLYGSNNTIIGVSTVSSTLDGEMLIGAGGTAYIRGNSIGVGIGTTVVRSALTVSGVTSTTSLFSTNSATIDGLLISQDSIGTGNIRLGDSSTLGISGDSQHNIGIGQQALNNIRGGDYNIAIGYQAAQQSNIGDIGAGNNISIGYQAFKNLRSGSTNVVIGNQSLHGTTTSPSSAGGNVSIGNAAGYNARSLRFNALIGENSGYNLDIGDWNTFLGWQSGYNITSGNYNIYLGSVNGKYSSVGENRIVIGNGNGSFFNREFDAPTSGSKQLAIGFNTSGTSEYWLVGNSSLNVGVGNTNPQYKLDVGGDINFTGTLYQNGVAFAGGGGGSGNDFYDGGIVTGNIVLTASNKNQLIPVSTGSSISITLPLGSELTAGDGFTIVDVGSSETSSGNAAIFNITVIPNSADRIMGGTGPLIIDENSASVKLVWMGSTYDWRIV